PEPALLPADPAARADARLVIFRFDRFGDAYYAVRRGDPGAWDPFQERLAELDARLEAQPFVGGREYGLADIAYIPWVLRARHTLGIDLEPFRHVAAWAEGLIERPAVAAEVEVVEGLARA